MSSSIPATGTMTTSELEEFFGAAFRVLDVSNRAVDFGEPVLEAFFRDAAAVIEVAEARRREIDRTASGRFNVFHLIDPDENKLSDILADLLDPRGPHGQGDRFLRLMLTRLDLDPQANLRHPAWVVREAPTHGIEKYRRRIDILVEAGALVAIENKVDAAEQYEQVKDYLDHLRVVSGGWSVPAVLVYLTPDGREPSSIPRTDDGGHRASGRLRCWSYAGELREWLSDCRAACEADKIRHFLGDFTAYIEAVLPRSAPGLRDDRQP